MSRWLKLARGILGTGVTFALAVSGFFASLAVGRWILLGADLDLRFLLIETILTGAAPFGFVTGVLFSGGLALTARGRSLRGLSVTHLGALGAGAAVILSTLVIGLPSLTLQWVVQVGAFALLGGGTAAGSLLVARRGERRLDPPVEMPGLSPGPSGDGE